MTEIHGIGPKKAQELVDSGITTIEELRKNVESLNDTQKTGLKYYDDIKEFTGKSGSTFFVDSYGLHKGEAPKGKSRILLNIHFGSGKILYSPGDIFHKIN